MRQRSPWMRPGPAENVQIPAPPGHSRVIERFGATSQVITCACGWRSLVLPNDEAEKAYDRHLDALGSWCDFCGGLWPLPVEFKCRDFSLSFGTVDPLTGEPQQFVYEGSWSACAPCAELVLAGSWARLAERCVEMTLEVETGRPFDKRLRSTPFYRRSVAQIKLLHSAFRQARAGLS